MRSSAVALSVFLAVIGLPLVLQHARAEDPAAPTAPAQPPAPVAPATPEDAVVTEADFGCLQEWEQVGRTRFTNVLGDLDGTLSVARDPDGGGAYPVGTVVQLMPTEAMVKRAPGHSPDTDDWEYLKLSVSKKGEVEIVERGGAEVRNIAGGCHDCHATEARWDHVCMEGHGCKPLPKFIVKSALKAVDKDPRCGS